MHSVAPAIAPNVGNAVEQKQPMRDDWLAEHQHLRAQCHAVGVDGGQRSRVLRAIAVCQQDILIDESPILLPPGGRR